MFDGFAKKVSSILDRIKNSGTLTESDIDAALREIRVAMLSADVSVDIAKSFIKDIADEIVGEKILKSLSPGQMVSKIVHAKLVDILSAKSNDIDFSKTPTKIMLVGLQGAGKTTTAAKIAHLFKRTYKSKTAIVGSVDVYRPAAIDQLRVLVKKIGCSFFETDIRSGVLANSKNLSDVANSEAVDLVVLDTAGRLQIDEMKMQELVALEKQFTPDEILLVVDIMTGQEAINIAKTFASTLNITGIVLTRVDGDSRGGVALSMKAATGVPIKYLCSGEKLEQIERFYPERIANRILDIGDIMTLVENAQMTIGADDMQRSAERVMSGVFDLNDYADNLRKMSSLGGISGMIKYLPNFQGISDILNKQNVSNDIIKTNLAIISSMTAKERKNSSIIDGSRRKRIASGSGTSVQAVNRLLKQYDGMRSVMKKVKNVKKQSDLLGLLRGFKR